MKYTFTIDGNIITIDEKILEELAKLIGHLNKADDIQNKLYDLEMYFQITKNLDNQLKRLYDLARDNKKLMRLLAVLVKLIELEKEFRKQGITVDNAELYNRLREKFNELIKDLSKGGETTISGSW